jgi:hypothetical protein
MYLDRCGSCELPLRQCQACQGVVGPFDRFCGFCGHDLSAGDARPSTWRLWLLVAMIPLIAGIVFGISPMSGTLATRITQAVFRPVPSPAPSPSPIAGKTLRSQNLKVVYVVPTDWSGFDYSLASKPQKLVVVTRIQSDANKVADLGGDLTGAKPAGTVMTLGPNSGTSSSDPGILLAFQAGQLIAGPPAGTKVEIARETTALSIDGHPSAEVVFKLTRADGSVWFLERAYISNPAGPASLFRVEALASQADWTAGDQEKIDSVITSIRLT